MSQKLREENKHLRKENSELKAMVKTLKDSMHEVIVRIKEMRETNADELHRRQGG